MMLWWDGGHMTTAGWIGMVIMIVFWIAVLVGIIYLVSLGEYLGPYMRSSAVWWVLGSFVLSLGSLHFFSKQRFREAGTMLFVSLLGMVVNRHIVRLIHLEGHFNPADLTVKPQWSVFVVFLVCFLLALAVIAFMLRLFFQRQTAEQGATSL